MGSGEISACVVGGYISVHSLFWGCWNERQSLKGSNQMLVISSFNHLIPDGEWLGRRQCCLAFQIDCLLFLSIYVSFRTSVCVSTELSLWALHGSKEPDPLPLRLMSTVTAVCCVEWATGSNEEINLEKCGEKGEKSRPDNMAKCSHT